ncbi:DMT family transporter [Thalassococcus sp. S3]|uniref:DMT family transporter n=1 Tax=Thalassococcus sp. S3 TaxID=2017482 RepID=UPI001024490D|nr:DMT family transporter [Thalassococcus sp. S3]QBF31049.1 hypothetical protein CFI11_07425 [Thalassococcus sp. S3]
MQTPILQTRPLLAAASMVAAMSVIGVIDNVIPLIAAEIGLWQFHATRASLAIPLVVAMSLLGFGALRPLRLWAVALRSALVATSMLFYFTALALMPIAQALAGLFTSPIFILLISALVLKDPVGPWRVLAVAIGFVGILLVLQPDPSRFDVVALIPVAGGFFYALGAVATRSLCGGESTMSLLAGMWLTLGAMGLVGLFVLSLWPAAPEPGAAGFVTRAWVWPMWQSAPWVAVQAAGSVIGVFLIIKAYQLGEPSYVSVFEYSVMIFGPLFAFLVFDQAVTQMQILGIFCIALAGGVIALRSK